jgi:hypothetical protein
MDKLKTNGFMVRYFYPNTILISWQHWIPSYVRNELKKKTGIIVNEYGIKIGSEDTDIDTGNKNGLKKITQNEDPNQALLNTKEQNNSNINSKSQKKFTPIDSYKPTGNLFFNDN